MVVGKIKFCSWKAEGKQGIQAINTKRKDERQYGYWEIEWCANCICIIRLTVTNTALSKMNAWYNN